MNYCKVQSFLPYGNYKSYTGGQWSCRLSVMSFLMLFSAVCFHVLGFVTVGKFRIVFSDVREPSLYF